MKIGPRSADQLRRFRHDWQQGEHVLISGATGSGKTTLAREIDQVRIDRGGFVVVFVGKLKPDETITDDYKGFVRWTKWKRNPSRFENRVLLWPDTDKFHDVIDKRNHQREIFQDAINHLANTGLWTVHFDEGLYMCDPRFLRLDTEIAMLHALGRSSKLTLVTLTQRPSHLPLILYSSAAHAFVGRTREQVDNKRLGELGGRESSRELSARINSQGRREFLWIPVATDEPSEVIDLKR